MSRFEPIIDLSLLSITEIKKKGDEPNSSPEHDDEIERLLHGYVSMCHNAAMEMMKTN